MATPVPFYDVDLSYDENFDRGPFGAFADRKTYESIGEPTYDFLGYKIHTPFGIPAGPLLNSTYVKAALDKGFDVVHYKTQRSTVFAVNQFPNVLYLDLDGDLTLDKAAQPQLGLRTTNKSPKDISITNSFGNPSRGPEFWVDDLREAVNHEKPGQLVVMSVVGTVKPGFSEEDYFDDFAKTAELAAQTGVKVVEGNYSCPNVSNEGVLCYNPQAVEVISRRMKERIGDIPLLIKLGYYSEEQQELLEKIIQRVSPFVDGISTINTIAAPIVDENGNQALPGPNRLKSGVCGAGVKWAGLDMVQRLAQIRDNVHGQFTIIGVGGVMTPQDYFAYRDAGADLVQSATGAMWNPYLAQEIKSAQ